MEIGDVPTYIEESLKEDEEEIMMEDGKLKEEWFIALHDYIESNI